jgi:hypothetical protein
MGERTTKVPVSMTTGGGGGGGGGGGVALGAVSTDAGVSTPDLGGGVKNFLRKSS